LVKNILSVFLLFLLLSSGSQAIVVYNYPNPFNPSTGQTTEINYTLAANANVDIYIYNIIGRRIAKLSCSSGSQGGLAGYNGVTWNGQNESAEIMPNDIYLAYLISGGKQIGKCKIVIIK